MQLEHTENFSVIDELNADWQIYYFFAAHRVEALYPLHTSYHLSLDLELEIHRGWVLSDLTSLSLDAKLSEKDTVFHESHLTITGGSLEYLDHYLGGQTLESYLRSEIKDELAQWDTSNYTKAEIALGDWKENTELNGTLHAHFEVDVYSHRTTIQEAEVVFEAA